MGERRRREEGSFHCRGSICWVSSRSLGRHDGGGAWRWWWPEAKNYCEFGDTHASEIRGLRNFNLRSAYLFMISPSHAYSPSFTETTQVLSCKYHGIRPFPFKAILLLSIVAVLLSPAHFNITPLLMMSLQTDPPLDTIYKSMSMMFMMFRFLNSTTTSPHPINTDIPLRRHHLNHPIIPIMLI